MGGNRKTQKSFNTVRTEVFVVIRLNTVFTWNILTPKLVMPVLKFKQYRDQTWFFHALTFARSLGRCWKLRPLAAVFNTSQGTWRMLMHWKTMFNRYYCIKTENICYISCYFLHYFVSLFHRCLANTISTDWAGSRAGQYTSRNDSKSVAPVQSYWKLRSRALTAHELPC